MQVQMIKDLKTRAIRRNIYIWQYPLLYYTYSWLSLTLIAPNSFFIFFFYWTVSDIKGLLFLMLWAVHCCKIPSYIKYLIFTCPAKEGRHNVLHIKTTKDPMTCKRSSESASWILVYLQYWGGRPTFYSWNTS